MMEFLFGLVIGLTVAWWVKRRADAHWINTNIAIYEGYLTPDENGYVGFSRFPESGRFPEVGMSSEGVSK